MNTLFYVAGAVAVAATVMTITRLNAVHALLYLIVSLLAVAVVFYTMGAPFVAALEVVIYAGAIMVLFVFAIMILIPGKEESGPDPRRGARIVALPVGGLLMLLLVFVIAARWNAPRGAVVPSGSAAAVGRLLFTSYLFPFELTSVLLLAAMVGVMLLARRRA